MKSMSTLPRFLHIGMPKSGSSFLYTLLKQHPGVNLSKLQKINFYGQNFSKGWDWYWSLFDQKDDKVPVDTSPKLFQYGSEAAFRIKQYISEPRFLVILRNPANYVFSHYRMHFNNGFFLKNYRDKFEKNPSFKEIVEKLPEYLERGKYFKNFQVWLEYFNLSNFHVVIFENFVREPQKYMDRIFDFFLLDKIQIEPVRETSKNVAMKNPLFYKFKRFFLRHEKLKNVLKKSRYLDRTFDLLFTKPSHLPDEYRSVLFEYYKEDMAQLGELLKINTSIWKIKNNRDRL